MRSQILLILGLLLVEVVRGASAAPSKVYTYVGHEIEPFFYKAGSQGVQGAYFDVVNEVCKKRRWQCKFKIAPFRASIDMIQSGKADFGGPMALTEQRKTIFSFSDPIFETGYCFYASPRNYQGHMTYQNLIGKSVGVFGPSATELSLQRVNEVTNQQIKTIQEPDYHSALRKAESNTYNFTYANCDTGKHWIERYRSQLKEVPGLRDTTLYHVVFTKKNSGDQDLRDFNETLKELRKSGFLENVAEKYKIKLAPSVK